jgi:hypothetical protein
MPNEPLCLTGRAGRIGIELRALPMGKDLTVLISGGDRPHLGAAALGVPRPSLRDPARRSASVSVLTLTGHHDDEFARRAAHRLAAALGAPVLVACGIHADKLTGEELAALETRLEAMLGDCERALGIETKP